MSNIRPGGQDWPSRESYLAHWMLLEKVVEILVLQLFLLIMTAANHVAPNYVKLK